MTVTMTNDDHDEEDDKIALQVGSKSLSDLGPMGTVMGATAVQGVITRGAVRIPQ